MDNATQIVERKDKSDLGSAWVVIACPDSGKVLLGKRSKDANNSGQWNLFGGGIEGKESPIQTALRELWEEAGIKVPASRLRKLGIAPGNMSVFVLDLTPDQARIAVKLNKLEVAKAKWFSLDDLPANLHKSAYALLHVVNDDIFDHPQQAPTMRQVLDMVESADAPSQEVSWSDGVLGVPDLYLGRIVKGSSGFEVQAAPSILDYDDDGTIYNRLREGFGSVAAAKSYLEKIASDRGYQIGKIAKGKKIAEKWRYASLDEAQVNIELGVGGVGGVTSKGYERQEWRDDYGRDTYCWFVNYPDVSEWDYVSENDAREKGLKPPK